MCERRRDKRHDPWCGECVEVFVADHFEETIEDRPEGPKVVSIQSNGAVLSYLGREFMLTQ